MLRSHAPHPFARPPLVARPVALLCTFILFAIILSVLGVGSANADERSVTVMTQNLYQGTEFARIQALVTGLRQPKRTASTIESILSVLQASGARPLTFWASAICTDQPQASSVSWTIPVHEHD